MAAAGQWGAEAPLLVSGGARPSAWHRIVDLIARPLRPLFWLWQWSAKREYREALRLLASPKIAQAPDRELMRLGDICLNAGDRARAAASYWAAARTLAGREQHQKAAALYKRVVAIVPMDPRARVELAACFERLMRKREAAQQYGVAGQLLQHTAPVEALQLLSYALTLDPRDLEGRAHLTALRASLNVPQRLSFAPAPEPAATPEPRPMRVNGEPELDLHDALTLYDPVADAMTTEYGPQDLARLLAAKEDPR